MTILINMVEKYALYGYENRNVIESNNNSINNLTLSVDKDILYNNHN